MDFNGHGTLAPSLVADRQLVTPRRQQADAGCVVLRESWVLAILALAIWANDFNRHAAGPPRSRKRNGGDPHAAVIDARGHNWGMAPEPHDACVGCGRPTRVGTPLFSDRRTTRAADGTALHLCGDCNERAVSHYGRQPTERDMVQIAARGAGLGFAAHGGMGAGSGPV